MNTNPLNLPEYHDWTQVNGNAYTLSLNGKEYLICRLHSGEKWFASLDGKPIPIIEDYHFRKVAIAFFEWTKEDGE